jgi:prophage antirepressor-like protein
MQTNIKVKLQLFESVRVRTVWDEAEEKWWFSALDVVAALTDQTDYAKTRNYWKWLKSKLKQEGSEVVSSTNQLKLQAPDGKQRLTDVLDTQQIFRIIQSIPSKKAEPFKLWLAEVANQRIDQLQDPELSIEQAMLDYKRLGYSDNWINQRLKSIEIRKELSDEWKKRGLQEGAEFAFLTDVIYKTWADKTAKEYKQLKGLKKENLRDNMTNKELVMNMLAELSTKEISEVVNPQSFAEHEDVAKRGGGVAKEAKLQLEAETGKKVVTSQSAKQLQTKILIMKNHETTDKHRFNFRRK